MKGKAESNLERIASVLMSDTRFIDNPGLFNGKMGIAIFLYHLARFNSNKQYEDFAGSLIDDICESLGPKMGIEFANGLTGIGWGIEYLVQNRFLEADTDDVLVEIDNAAYSGFMNIPFLIQNKDLNGLGLYYLTRIKGRESNENNLKVTQIKTKLIYFIDSCERLLTKEQWFGINVLKPSVEQLNSIVFFLNEVTRLGLFPVKTKRLLNYIPKNSGFYPDLPNVERYTLWTLTKESREGQVKNKFPYEIFSIVLLDNNELDKNDEDTVISEFIRCNWNTLLYNVNFTFNETFRLYFEKVNALINDDFNWNNYLKKLNSNNLGLYNGLAGLGMSILQFSKNLVAERKFSRY